ncbi:MAG: 50S ribosomal protein L4 [Mycoplasmoidaceae bacterium]
MEKVNLVDLSGNIKKVELKNTSLIEKKPSKQAIFDSILSENSGSRQGTHSTKTKAEVRGGGRKPWRQKHTGKARQGSIRAPQWVGGGVVFGPKPNRNYSIKLNKKIRKLALRSAITFKFQDDCIYLLADDVNMKKPSTNKIAIFLEKLALENKKVLFILNEEKTDTFKLSCRNIQKISSKNWNQVSTRDIVNSHITICQESAFDKLSEVFA